MEPTEDEKSASDLWAFSPESRRFVLRDGSTWRRLVMRGIVNDPEMKQKWANNREQIRQRQIEAAKQARIYGFGLAGGVTEKASNRKVPEVEPEAETKTPEVKPKAPDAESKAWYKVHKAERKLALAKRKEELRLRLAASKEARAAAAEESKEQ